MAFTTAMLLGRDNEAEAVIRSAGISMGGAALNMFKSRGNSGNEEPESGSTSHGFRRNKETTPVTEASFLKFQKKYFKYLKKQHERELQYTASLKKEDRDTQETNLERRARRKTGKAGLIGAGLLGAGAGGGAGDDDDANIDKALAAAAGALLTVGKSAVRFAWKATKFTGSLVGRGAAAVGSAVRNILKPTARSIIPNSRHIEESAVHNSRQKYTSSSPKSGEKKIIGNKHYVWKENLPGSGQYSRWVPDPSAASPKLPASSVDDAFGKLQSDIASKTPSTKPSTKIPAGAGGAAEEMGEAALRNADPPVRVDDIDKQRSASRPATEPRPKVGDVRNINGVLSKNVGTAGALDRWVPVNNTGGAAESMGEAARTAPADPPKAAAPVGGAKKVNEKQARLKKAKAFAKSAGKFSAAFGLGLALDVGLLYSEIESDAEEAAEDGTITTDQFNELIKAKIKTRIESHIGEFGGALAGGIAGAKIGFGVLSIPFAAGGAWLGSIAGDKLLTPIVTDTLGRYTEPLAGVVYRGLFSEDPRELQLMINKMTLKAQIAVKSKQLSLAAAKQFTDVESHNTREDAMKAISRVSDQENEVLKLQGEAAQVEKELADISDKRDGKTVVPISPAGVSVTAPGEPPVRVTTLPEQNIPGDTTTQVVPTPNTPLPQASGSQAPNSPNEIQTRNHDKALKTAVTNTQFMTDSLWVVAP